MNSNETIQKIGYGTWKIPNDILDEALKNALDVGYKHIDTARAYGNEKLIGEALIKINRPRNELFITGKLWNDDRDNVIEACQETIKNLQCDYLDLYLMHWPASKAVHDDWIDINNKVWQQMEELVNLGLVKNIGVCNFKINQLEELLKTCKIKPFVNQIEIHPGLNQKEIIDYCQQNEILIEAWGPLGSGKMIKREQLQQIASKYDKTVAQICLRWCLQNGAIPIVRSTNKERMESNLEVFDFEITKEDMEYLNSLPYIGGSGLDSETLTLFN